MAIGCIAIGVAAEICHVDHRSGVPAYRSGTYPGTDSCGVSR
jgi:hypothetical protein